MLRQYIDKKRDLTSCCLILFLILMKIIPTRLGDYMNKQLRFIFLLLLVILPGLRYAHAQTTFASEDELKQQALKLFEDDEFEEAYPLYSQLASLYPKDPNYNYRLGVCMLYASDDKEKAIPFLEFSAKKPDVEKEAIFYLAKAYHLNYRFDDAILQYQAYMKVASSSKAEKLQVEHQIEMCRSGKKLLRNITDLVVIEKKELSRSDFYRAYDISDIGGKLLAKPDEESFKTSLDKKKKEKSIIYLATNNNQVYFSSYGDDLDHGKDIYVIRKLPGGEWSKPQTLGYPVNTEYDEDFPFLHPNGKVLYFCSKGHNSMGGYDIFKTTLNEETNTWNMPVNVDFPINTPDDDILYVTNADEKEAYFSSARSSKTGKTAVYHINVERRPIDVAIIKGMVIKTKDNQALDVKITVKDLADNTILGIYNAKEAGNYLINLPNGGRFMYTVEAAGFNTQSEVVVLPTQYEFKPLKQEISYEPGTDKLIIKNLFDEPVDDQSYLLALNFIKEKSKLEGGVDAANAAAAKNKNSPEDNASALNNAAKNTDNSTDKSANNADNSAGNKNDNSKTNASPAGNLSNDAIVKIAYDDAQDAEKEAKDLQEQADIALNLANQKNELAQNKTKEATQLMSDANGMSDNVKKQTVIDEANQAREESEELNQETVAAFNIAKKLQQKAAAKDEEADLSLQYAKDLEAAVKSKNPTEALAKLAEQEKKLEALSEKNGNAEPDNIYSGLKMDADTKKRELDKATQVSADIKQEIADNITLMGTLQTDAEKAKKEDLKKGLLDQIEGLKADNEESKKDLEANEQKIAKLTKEFNGIKNEMELVSNVADKAKTGTNEDAAASVAAIDKTKLEAQVNEIKNNTSDNSTAIAKTNSDSKSNTSKTNNVSENAASTDVAATNTSSENKSGNNSSTDNSTAGNITADIASNNNTDYTKQYSGQLAAADNISNSLEKENKKAEILKDWVNAITADIANKKEEAKTEKDKAKKKELTTEIAALEKELKLKQEDEKTAVASVESIKKQETAAVDNSSKTNNNTGDNASNTNTAANNNSAVNDNAATTNNNTPDNSSSAAPVASIGSINQTFSDKLADAEKISDEISRENSKSAVLKDWSAAINANIEKQKQDMNVSTDPEMKALLAKKISDAEKLSQEKQSMATASSEKAKTLEKQSGIASNSGNKSADNSTNGNAANNNTATDKTNTDIAAGNQGNNDAGKTNNTTANNASDKTKTADVAANNAGNNSSADNAAAGQGKSTASDASLNPEEKLNKALAVATNAGTELERENKKKEAYLYYVADMNEQLTAKQNELKTEKDKTKKKELNNEIAAISSDIKEKQKEADASEIKVKELQSQAVASSANSDKSNSTDNAAKTNDAAKTNSDIAAADNSAKTNNDAGNNADQSSVGSDNNSALRSSTLPDYTNADAVKSANLAVAANREAEQLTEKANDLRTQAGGKSKEEEKNALLTQANELMAQADAKKLSAVQLLSDANKSEFIANQDGLNQLAAATTNNTSDEAAMAEMMKDEAKIYFDKAQKSRALAGSLTSDQDRLAAFEDATANEKTALGKQKKATELYKKANPDFVAAANKNQENATNTSADVSKANSGNAGKADVAVNTTQPDNASGDQSKTNTAATDASKTNDAANSNDNAALNNSSAASSDNTNKNKSADLSKTNDQAVNTNSDNAAAANDQSKANDAGKTNDLAANNEAKTNSDNAASTNNNQSKTNDAAIANDAAANNGSKTNADNASKINDAAKSNDLAANNEVKTNSGNDAGTTTDQSKTNDAAINPADNNSTKTNETANKTADENSAAATNTGTATNPENKTKVVLAPTEKFERTTKPVYSSAKPIPVNEQLPEGLVYKVQIGAFRNPIAPEQFNGMSPITAETTPQGLTRYTAGFFTKFSTADQVKNEIRELGYKDAFVVVFLNGKRISVAEALRMQGESGASVAANNTPAITNANNAVPSSSENTAANAANANNANVNAGAADNSTPATKQNTALTQDVILVTGLFYTVQVGVYSQPVSAAKLFNIQPLYAENIANGNIRYNTGIYNNLPKAVEAKNIVVNAGVKDAYVTAYYQGKRISLAEAAALETQGSGVFTTAANINQLPTLSGNAKSPVINNPPAPAANKPQETAAPPVSNPPVNIPAEEPKANPVTPTANNNEPSAANTELKNTVELNNTATSDSGVVFKVQIGAFKDEVPLEIANQFLKIASKGIKNYKDANGLTIYTLGSFKTYDEALQLKNEIGTIVSDAFVVAYNNGSKISLDEAKTLQNK